jgi:hypothetical protein
MPVKPVVRQLSPESRFRVEHRGEELRVSYRWYQKGMWMFVPWCPMAIAILAFNGRAAFRNGEAIRFTLGCLIVLVFCYLMLVALVNRTELVLTHTTLLLRDGPLPWPGAPKVLPTQQIVQFFVDKYEVSDTKDRWKRRYSLNAVMQGGKAVRLFYGQKRQDDLLTLEAEIEDWLGLENVPVEHRADRKRPR